MPFEENFSDDAGSECDIMSDDCLSQSFDDGTSLKRAPVFRNGLLMRNFTMAKGSLDNLSPKVKEFITEKANWCKPDKVYICDGSDAENGQLVDELVKGGVLKPLKYDNCYLCLTDPKDVARVESKTCIVTDSERETRPTPKDGVKGQLNIWMDPKTAEKELDARFPGCMKGRTMYVIPFSMGPVGSPLSKIGIQLTDSSYVVANMRIMTRMGQNVLDALGNGEFVRCLHSVGQPLPMATPAVNNWPCNPEKTLITHFPKTREIISFGSGYGGNSLLGKKCFALRIASCIARDEGWLAEHMLIMGLTNPKGEKKYIAAAFPSACGKTNLAMMTPTIPGWKVECVGDDIAWMRFDDNGVLRAINPEAGFFGVAPGTSTSSNPIAMDTVFRNSIFTNCAETDDKGVYWEGLEEVLKPGQQITSWLKDKKWSRESGKPAAHPNSRFCTPARQCPIMDPAWESQEGVPISAILFGGRRPEGIPLVYEAFDWNHAVFMGATVRSESTAAAEHKAKVIMHDPFAMRPFFGYNFGDYIQHWLSLQNRKKVQLPKVFHVNWFRKSPQGKFLWPGFGENARVLEWILKRVNNEKVHVESPIGYLPASGTINTEGLSGVDMDSVNKLDKKFLQDEAKAIRTYLEEQVNKDLPEELWNQMKSLENRISKM